MNKQLSEEALESINILCCKENNVEFDANGDTLYSFANLLSVTTEALTNPEIYTKADLISKEDALGFARYCKHHTSPSMVITDELFTLYQQTK